MARFCHGEQVFLRHHKECGDRQICLAVFAWRYIHHLSGERRRVVGIVACTAIDDGKEHKRVKTFVHHIFRRLLQPIKRYDVSPLGCHRWTSYHLHLTLIELILHNKSGWQQIRNHAKNRKGNNKYQASLQIYALSAIFVLVLDEQHTNDCQDKSDSQNQPLLKNHTLSHY